MPKEGQEASRANGRDALQSTVGALSVSVLGESEQKRTWAAAALTIIAAVGLVTVLVVFLPRPVLDIERVEFITTACDPASHSRQVTASMTIRNTGPAPGFAYVHLLVDGHIAATGSYPVRASSSVQEGLQTILRDCEWHRFAVELFEPPSMGP